MGCEPTYEELKQRDIWFFLEEYQVASLPMRN